LFSGRKGLKSIPETDIGFSILCASTTTYCNPHLGSFFSFFFSFSFFFFDFLKSINCFFHLQIKTKEPEVLTSLAVSESLFSDSLKSIEIPGMEVEVEIDMDDNLRQQKSQTLNFTLSVEDEEPSQLETQKEKLQITQNKKSQVERKQEPQKKELSPVKRLKLDDQETPIR